MVLVRKPLSIGGIGTARPYTCIPPQTSPLNYKLNDNDNNISSPPKIRNPHLKSYHGSQLDLLQGIRIVRVNDR